MTKLSSDFLFDVRQLPQTIPRCPTDIHELHATPRLTRGLFF